MSFKEYKERVIRMEINEETTKARHDKHIGHDLSEEYSVDADLDWRIRICRTCNIAVLYIIYD